MEPRKITNKIENEERQFAVAQLFFFQVPSSLFLKLSLSKRVNMES